MTPETKRRIRLVADRWALATRRLALRTLRYLFDAIEERLHAAEVRLREEIAGRKGTLVFRQSAPRAASLSFAARGSETLTKWKERRCSAEHARFQRLVAGLDSPAPLQRLRKRGVPARAFDLRFSSR